jgi:quercetin dioxygenase-like cupin family protein
MSRSLRLLSLAVLVVGMAVFAQTSPITRAQESTPAAAEMSMEGLSYTPLGVLTGVALPSPADMEVARVGFEPGAGFPLDPNDPTGALVIVESGSLTVTVVEQAWTISRGAAIAQAMASPSAEPDMSAMTEEVAMGAEGTLQAGDVAYVPGSINGTVSNTGAEPATALIVQMAPQGMLMGGATPTP